MRNTQYNIELSVHKQPSVFNTTYTIQCRVNCPNNLIHGLLREIHLRLVIVFVYREDFPAGLMTSDVRILRTG